MANRYLARDDAPFDAEVWQALDEAMLEAAKGQLTGRRLLPVEGPFGLGLKAVPLADVETEAGSVARILPIVWVRQSFSLGMRDLAAFERDPLALDLDPLIEAAIAAARQEDELIFHGAPGVPGLLTAEGVQTLQLSAPGEVGTMAGDVMQAITLLDDAGFHGPYALALAPALYNRLFHLYHSGMRSELDHIQSMATEGVFKAPALKSGGVLLATGRQYASLILGQDMTVGFVGPADGRLEFTVTESLAPLVRRPQAVCVLKPV